MTNFFNLFGTLLPSYSYVREKASYKGPWNIPKRRAKKHPLAPKRPMSAFLKYSQTRRSVVKQENPDMSNTDVSRLLGEMWRGHSEKERRPYVEQEEGERAIYKREMAEFKAKQARQDAASRIPHSCIPRENQVARALPSSRRDPVPSYHDAPPAESTASVYHHHHQHQDAAGYRQESIYRHHDVSSAAYRHHPSSAIQRQGSNVSHHPYSAHFGYSFSQGMATQTR
jgi:hypothetical protein